MISCNIVPSAIEAICRTICQLGKRKDVERQGMMINGIMMNNYVLRPGNIEVMMFEMNNVEELEHNCFVFLQSITLVSDFVFDRVRLVFLNF